MEQPPWMREAWAEFGQKELAGPESNARIVALYKDAGHPNIKSDAIAWCAAYLGACLERSGIHGTRSLMARSYGAWGREITEARPGAVAVLSRTTDPTLGHVGFVLAERGDDLILLSGNQSDAVTVAAFPKSRLISLRWPSETPRQDVFERALTHVLAMEGGFSDDPYDPGGPTNKGITLAVFAAWKGVRLTQESTPQLLTSLKAITAQEVAAIYRERYWKAAACAELQPALAVMHFDTAVNHGPGTAIRILQEVVRTEADGEFGPITLAAISRMPMAALLAAYAENRRQRYRAMAHFWRFGRGWLNRVDSTLALAQRVAREPATTSLTKGDKMTPEVDGTTNKWWGSSMTIWGALTTGLAALLPALGPLFGLDLTADLVAQLGSQSLAALQAIVALAGTFLTITGRTRAILPLTRRAFNVRL